MNLKKKKKDPFKYIQGGKKYKEAERSAKSIKNLISRMEIQSVISRKTIQQLRT